MSAKEFEDSKTAKILKDWVDSQIERAVARALKSRLLAIQQENADSVQGMANSIKEVIEIQRVFLKETQEIHKRLKHVEKLLGVAFDKPKRRHQKKKLKGGYIS